MTAAVVGVRMVLRRRRVLALVALSVWTCGLTYSYIRVQHYLREKAFLQDTLDLINENVDTMDPMAFSSSNRPADAISAAIVGEEHQPEMACKLPDPDRIDSHDPSIAKYIQPMASRIDCTTSDIKLDSSLDVLTGVLIIKNAGKNKCYYQSYKRIDDIGDSRLAYSKMQIIKNNSLNLDVLDIEFIAIKCYNMYHTLIYTRSHVNPLRSYLLPKKDDSNSNASNKDQPLNVFILIVESMSRITFNRFLTKTQQALNMLNRTSTVFDLKGLTKLADNSYPNMAALLTGE